MEIKNENKIKVLAQYIGCQVSIPAGYAFNGFKTDDKVGEFNGIRNEGFIHIGNIGGYYSFGHFQLILKPLSAITDEDALEVAKIVGFENPEVYSRTEDYVLIQEKGKPVNNKSVSIWFDGEILADGSERTTYEFSISEGISFVYQYLQSKGYDLPQYLLGGKTLKEAGLCIYE